MKKSSDWSRSSKKTLNNELVKVQSISDEARILRRSGEELPSGLKHQPKAFRGKYEMVFD